jgi:exodeoxyribonuclease-5
MQPRELGPDVGVCKKSCLRPDAILGHLLWADRILVARNNTRREINRLVLSGLGLGRYPTGDQREKLICLGNYSDAGLFNGTPVRLTDVALDKAGGGWLNARIERVDGGDVWTACGEHRIYLGHFEATDSEWNVKQAGRGRSADDAHIDRHGLIELDWAFATTCHKAQGSEWPNVLIASEIWPPPGPDGRRWRYTAVTRARSKLKIIEEWDRS